jgi:hypothetical protein
MTSMRRQTEYFDMSIAWKTLFELRHDINWLQREKRVQKNYVIIE